jgi:nucleotide-binding universal stress UspA family protein
MNPIQRILLPTDLTDLCEAAGDLALDLAARYDAEVVVLHAYEAPAYVYPTVAVDALERTLTVAEDVATAGVEALVTRLRERHPKVRGITLRGAPRDTILDAIAAEQCDLVVMATHGRSGLSRAFLGSVAEFLVRGSPVPVLTVRPRSRAA